MGSKNQLIQIKTKVSLSRNQKLFNSRSKKVQKLKAEFEELKEAIEQIKVEYHASIVPANEQIADVKTQIVYVFDTAYQQKFFRKKEKEKLASLIIDNAINLIDNHGKEELIPIYEKYSDMSYAEKQELGNAIGKDMLSGIFKSMTGVDIDLDGIDNPDDMEEIAKRVAASMEEKERLEQEKKSKRKKTKAQIRKEERLAKDAKNISKSSKDIYNQLVKEYHPDLEKDEEKKQEKTELMQKITEAYQNDDFFSLLNFQIQLKQDEEFLTSISEERLKYYNKILLDQVRQLEEMISYIKNPMSSEFSKYLYNHNKASQMIAFEKEDLESNLHSLKLEKEEFQDNKKLRAFLKSIEFKEDDFDDMPFFPFFDFDE